MKITREIKTAILVISSILLFIWGYSFLKGRDLLSDYRTFYVQYDNVEGLTASAPVTINGLVVGKVDKIEFMDQLGKIRVEMQIKSDFPISKSSVAALYEPGLIAGKQIQIIPNYEDKTPAESGATLPGKTIPGLTALVGEKLTPLQEDLTKVLVSADKLLGNVNEVLDKDSKANLRKAIAELRVTMEEFHKASGSLNGILDNNKTKIDGIVTNFNKVSKDFSSISDSLNKADLGKTAKNLQKTLNNVDKIIAGIESGNGTMGKLMKDDKLYKELTAASNELELLLQDVRLNPTRYVNVSLFGKKNKPYVAPVNDTVKK
ncbi:MlaD family protein [Flavobacterium sp.]|uniref:MlaD family protein n=1 Tax=Flavobacterium sp. TaxID=239 RepID=UPI0039E632B4